MYVSEGYVQARGLYTGKREMDNAENMSMMARHIQEKGRGNETKRIKSFSPQPISASTPHPCSER